jgi:hypothetical protein
MIGVGLPRELTVDRYSFRFASFMKFARRRMDLCAGRADFLSCWRNACKTERGAGYFLSFLTVRPESERAFCRRAYALDGGEQIERS